jgi:hypothetical protein
VLGAISGAVGLWGFGLLAAGLVFGLVRTPISPGSVAQVFPGILVFGGGLTALFGLSLWATSRAPSRLGGLRRRLGRPADPPKTGVDSPAGDG